MRKKTLYWLMDAGGLVIRGARTFRDARNWADQRDEVVVIKRVIETKSRVRSTDFVRRGAPVE